MLSASLNKTFLSLSTHKCSPVPDGAVAKSLAGGGYWVRISVPARTRSGTFKGSVGRFKATAFFFLTNL